MKYMIQEYVLYNMIYNSGGSVVKNLPTNAGDTGGMGLIPGLGRSSRGGRGNPLQFSFPENPMKRGAWWAHSP